MELRRLAVAMVAVALCGCGAPGGGTGAGPSEDLEFAFRSLGGDDQIDQTLTIENRGDASVAPRLEITPLDGDDKPIAGLKVATAYGSDRGTHVVPGKAEVLDILRFEGARKRDVEGVSVRVASAEEVPAVDPAPEEVEVERLGPDGNVVEYGEYHERLRILNPNDSPMPVRVVLIEYDMPPEGEAQQFVRVTPVTDLVEVPAGGESVQPLPAKLRDRVGSVKAFVSR
jgi:hypothetical protein